MEKILYGIIGRSGNEGKTRERKRERGKKGGRGWKEIIGEEVKRALKRIKDGKAMGLDGIPEEAWKYSGERLERWVRDYCNGVWKEEG